MNAEVSTETWTTVNPTTGQEIATYSFATDLDVNVALVALGQQHERFQCLSLEDRGLCLMRLAQNLREGKDQCVRLMAEEMGKPYVQGLAEIEKCAMTCEYYSENLERFLASETVDSHYDKTWIIKRPLGIILAVMPWNFPFWQVFRCAIPAWAAGNSVVLKHAPAVQGCALKIFEIIKESFRAASVLPFCQLPLTHQQTEGLIANPRINALSFTGSTPTGKHLAALAGAALKPSVLELGGSDPYIVLEDADVERAASLCVKARFINAGQSCVAGKRFFVHEKVYDDFKRYVSLHIQALRVGDPLQKETDVGPLAELRLSLRLEDQLARSLKLGAQIACQNSSRDLALFGRGFFVSPMLVEVLDDESPLATEEIFGPVMALFKIKSLEEGLQRANHSNFGLGAAVFTEDVRKVWATVVDQLQVGTLVFNDIVQSDPRVPFGGIKESGWGRELGEAGLNQFMNIKTVGLTES